MGSYISGLLLVFHFSLIFSITLFCGILYYRTRDIQIGRFMRVMLPLFLFTLIYYLYYHTDRSAGLISPNAVEGFSLFLLIAACITLAAYIQAVVIYLISLLVMEPKRRRIPVFITNVLIGLFLLYSLYFLILLNRESWVQALSIALNEMFLYSSILLIAPTIVASIYLRRNRGNENYRLLYEIMIAFYPMALTLPLDLLLLSASPFKLTLLTHSLYTLFVFFYIVRHYMINYEVQPERLPEEHERFFREHEISQREAEIVGKLVEGRNNREIAEELFISQNTVKTHVRNIYRKLQVTNRVQLIHAIREYSPSESGDHPEG